jgi:hypothetical protein
MEKKFLEQPLLWEVGKQTNKRLKETDYDKAGI